MAIKEGNLTIMVKDMDKSIDFYQSIGMELKNRWGSHYAQLSAPGMTIGLHPAGTESTSLGSGNLSIGFTANDFAEARSMLESAQIALTERTEEGGSFLHFSDPDGTQLYFIKPKW
jgi:catechol 2,3-dioxygenase-like lactoylglutathione lyase family enzyme